MKLQGFFDSILPFAQRRRDSAHDDTEAEELVDRARDVSVGSRRGTVDA
ncbi:MAG TPA: hypothetical protein VHS34_14780 [Terriglobales bacterium]|nr:hypothetical protein [Terriglobales bacterium]